MASVLDGACPPVAVLFRREEGRGTDGPAREGKLRLFAGNARSRINDATAGMPDCLVAHADRVLRQLTLTRNARAAPANDQTGSADRAPCANVLPHSCGNPLRQARRHWRHAASDDAGNLRQYWVSGQFCQCRSSSNESDGDFRRNQPGAILLVQSDWRHRAAAKRLARSTPSDDRRSVIQLIAWRSIGVVQNVMPGIMLARFAWRNSASTSE